MHQLNHASAAVGGRTATILSEACFCIGGGVRSQNLNPNTTFHFEFLERSKGFLARNFNPLRSFAIATIMSVQ